MRTRRATPLLVVLLSLATACSGSSDKPTVLPSLSPTPVATSSPVPIPAAARAKTPQGADAFVRFFFAQMNVAFATGGPEIIDGLSNAECVTCDNYEKAVAAKRQRNEYLSGDTFVVANVAAAPLEKLGTIVDVLGDIPARKVLDRAGRTLESLPSDGRFHFEVAVKTTAAGWTVSGIRRAQQS